METSRDLELEEISPTISCHALVGISAPKTLKIEGYIKIQRITIFIDSISIHNFTNYKLEKLLNFFVYLVLEFQVMIANGGIINCSGKYNKIKLKMGEHLLVIHMISIKMGSFDVVLWVQWLQSLGIVTLISKIFSYFS